MEIHRINEEQKIHIKSIDLLKSYDEIATKFGEIESDLGPIYMLINCAGMAICGTVEDLSVADARLMMDINFFGTYYPTRYLLPKMKEAGEGIIVITASQAAMVGIYGLGAYSSSKFALRGLAETVAMEASHCGVSVTLALPVDTDTPGFENEQITKPEITKIISGTGGLAKPENVAKQIIDDALNSSFFSILGFESWMITILCSGLSPWGGFWLTTLSALVMGPLKVIGAGIHWNFSRLIKNSHVKKEKSE